MLKVGGEVDALCTRCELTLAHTIIAMMGGKPVKVECNTCHAVHRYRGGASSSGSGGGRSTASRAPREKATTISFDELLRSKDMSTAQRYSPKASFQVDQVVEHPIFGTGFVSAVRDGGKIEVVFRTDVKLLIHGKV